MGKKLTLFLIDGTDYGPRTIEIGNWSGKAINSPSSSLIKMLERDDYDKPGVYVLKSDPKEELYSERVYIGEAENLRARLKQHIRDVERDFKECIAFISKDELLTKSHIKYIESRLISMAKDAKNAEIENGNQPSINTLSEADISDMEYFIEQIKIILPTVAYNFLLSNTSIEKEKSIEEIETEKIFKIKSSTYSAKLKISDDGFIVLKGSEANLNTSKSISSGWIKLRERLKMKGILIEKGDKYIFSENTKFDSVSAASATILGRQAAGPKEWVDESGRRYKEYLEDEVGEES